jgi:uncharacterized protein (TIGR03437 family)
MNQWTWCVRTLGRLIGVVVLGAGLCQAQSYNIQTVAGGSANSGTAAVMASLQGSTGLSLDASGNLYVAIWGADLIAKVTPSGGYSIVAGDRTNSGGAYYGDGGPAVGAGLNDPSGTAFDSAGNLYIADSANNRVRKVSTSGTITTVAGGGSNVTFGGQATQTFIQMGQGITVDGQSNLYVVTPGGGPSAQVLKIAPNGIITSIAGSPLFTTTALGDGGPATAAYIAPVGLAVDGSGNLYLADALNRIRKISTSGIITTIAGSNSSNYSGDGGPATSAGLNMPSGVAVDSSGNIYIADAGNYRVRKVTPDGTITTIAGTGRPGNTGDGGPATSATVARLGSIAVGADGAVYITDVRDSDGAALVRVLKPITGTPTIAAGGVVALSSTSNTIQAGEWTSIFGNNLASSTAMWNGDFPMQLGGASVTVDGKPAYLSYVSPTQINLQAPDDATTGVVNVVVTTSGGSATSSVTLAPFGPSFCLLDATHVAAIILRTDGSGADGGGSYDIVGPTGTSLGYKTVAAKAGDTVEFFAVGFGATNPSVPAGKGFAGAAPTTNPVQVLINNVPITPAFAGLSSAGLYQINVTLPAGLGSGDVSLVATVGGSSTPKGIVVSVQ